MGKKFLAVIAVVMVAAVAGLAVLGAVTNPNNPQPPATPTLRPTPSHPTTPPTNTPTQTPTSTQASTPAPSSQLKPTSLAYVQLGHTEDDWVISGYLTKGTWTDGTLPNARIVIVDGTTGEVYGETTTLSQMDFSQNLNVGGFSYALPSNAASVRVVFEGDGEWQGCTSGVFTVG